MLAISLLGERGHMANTEKPAVVSVRMDPNLKLETQVKALKEGRSITDLVVDLFQAYLSGEVILPAPKPRTREEERGEIKPAEHQAA
jgi:succinate dehydrogenase/fumarate reductase-like Fe-S protein